MTQSQDFLLPTCYWLQKWANIKNHFYTLMLHADAQFAVEIKTLLLRFLIWQTLMHQPNIFIWKIVLYSSEIPQKSPSLSNSTRFPPPVFTLLYCDKLILTIQHLLIHIHFYLKSTLRNALLFVALNILVMELSRAGGVKRTLNPITLQCQIQIGFHIKRGSNSQSLFNICLDPKLLIIHFLFAVWSKCWW